MIETLRITNPSGSTLQLDLRGSEETHGLLIFNLEGLGSPKATVTGISGPNVDGVRGTVVATDAKHAILTLAVTARGTDYNTAKNKVYEFFPVRKNITFRITTGSEDVSGEAIVESVEFNHFNKVDNAVISLYFPDPWLYDVSPDDIVQNFPPHETQKTIVYDGNVETGFLFQLDIETNGLMAMTITNSRGSQEFNLAAIACSPGDTLLIDSRLGQKSVILDDGSTQTNILHDMDLSSDWLLLYPGTNLFDVTFTDSDPDYDPRDSFLIEYWPLDETSGPAEGAHTTILDLSDSGSPGNNTGLGGNFYATAREFVPGSSQYFATSSPHTVLNPMGDFMVAFWVYLDALPSTGNYRPIIGANNDSGDDGGWEIKINDTGQVMFGLVNNGTWQHHSIGGPGTGSWTGNCFFCWYDWSLARAYIAKGTGSGTYSSVANPNAYLSNLYVGGGGGFGTDYMDGRLSGIVMYNRILTLEERSVIYAGGNGRIYEDLVEKCTAHWKFNPRHQGV